MFRAIQGLGVCDLNLRARRCVKPPYYFGGPFAVPKTTTIEGIHLHNVGNCSGSRSSHNRYNHLYKPGVGHIFHCVFNLTHHHWGNIPSQSLYHIAAN